MNGQNACDAWMGAMTDMSDGWTDGTENAWTGAMTDIADDVWMVGILTMISCR